MKTIDFSPYKEVDYNRQKNGCRKNDKLKLKKKLLMKANLSF